MTAKTAVTFIEPMLCMTVGCFICPISTTLGGFIGWAALSLMLLVVCIVAAIVVIFRTDFFEGTGVGKKK